MEARRPGGLQVRGNVNAGAEAGLQARQVGNLERLDAPLGGAVLLDDLHQVLPGAEPDLPRLGALHPTDLRLAKRPIRPHVQLGKNAPALVRRVAVQGEVDVEAVALDDANHAFRGVVVGAWIGRALLDGGDPAQLPEFTTVVEKAKLRGVGSVEDAFGDEVDGDG